MNTFMAIMSQLFWGVTVGALTAAFTTIGQGIALVSGASGAAYLWRKWRRGRHSGD